MTSAQEITFRTATNADGERIREIVYGVLSEYGLTPEPDGTDADLNDVEKNYGDRGGVFEVLLDGEGKILGTVGLFPIDDKTVELRKMYFAPELRGRGWGRKTMARMIGAARRLGFTRIHLETNSALKEAIGLYKSCGFIETFEGMHTCRCDQAFYLDL
jgi:putative acetyltransferase